MSHPVLSSASFILSRTLIYAALWFALWTAFDYLTGSESLRLRASADYILLYLFAGWLSALLSWKSGGDKKKRPE
jgi:hypothetical protein